MLFIVSTPIGNLEDISKRALDTLQNVDAILCEDTRRSSILLNHYQIKKPLISYHKFTEKQQLEKIIQEIQSGKSFALISDAGTPCINDPGQILVNECIEKGIKVSAIPGACSLIDALVLSGLDSSRFQFIGFLEKKPEEQMRSFLNYPGTTIAFESPQRLIDTLKSIEKYDPNRTVAVVREMTKTFEEVIRANVKKVLEHFEKSGCRGEIVVCIEQGQSYDDLSIQECVEILMQFHGLTLKEAIKIAAKLKNTPKNQVYKLFHT